MSSSLYLPLQWRKFAADCQPIRLPAPAQRKGAWAASSAHPTSGRRLQVFNPDPFSNVCEYQFYHRRASGDRM